jgi:hypothetical protein
MNDKNHIDYFENFLKEATENFKMIPSKKVWRSIYNNVHPSKKWPSLTSVLFILVSYLILGSLNHNPESLPYYSAKINLLPKNSNARLIIASSFYNKSKINQSDNNLKKTNSEFPRKKKNTIQHIKYTTTNLLVASPDKNEKEALFSINKSVPSETSNLVTIYNRLIIKSNPSNKVLTTQMQINDEIKTKNNFSYQIYASSSVGFGNIYKNTDLNSVSETVMNSSMSEKNKNEAYQFRHLPGYNFEAGGTFLLNISKFIRLKAGMQLNYSNYKSIANTNKYSGFAFVQVNDGYSSSASPISSISNINAEENNNMNSNTYQISLPIGSEFKIAGNKKLQWYAGATVQPSYIVGNNPYFVSPYMINYFQDESFLRKWNLNSSIETFLSYTLNNGTSINAGPQFRYQLFSTFDNRYLYNEKLYNIGLKFGISRVL